MSKNKKKARMAVPPPQSRGGPIRQMPGKPQQPGQPVKQEISEIDALKYRLAIQKDNNVQAQLKVVREKKAAMEQEFVQKKAAMEKEEENLNLRISLTRMENRRDIGHLEIKTGDKFIEENGKFFIVRAPGSTPAPVVTPPSPPEPPADEEPPDEDPEQEEEPLEDPGQGEDPTDGDQVGDGEGDAEADQDGPSGTPDEK